MKCAYTHDEFRRRVNRNNRGDGKYPEAIEIDSVINYAKEVWYSNRIQNREIDSTAREEIRNFEISNVSLKLEKKGDIYMAILPDDYYQKSYFKVKATKKGCEECGKDLIPIIVKGDNYNFAIKDPDRRTSYEYEEILYDEKSDGMYFYTLGECEVKEVLLDYFQKIPDQLCPSELIDREYVTEEGKVVKRDINLPEFNLNSKNDILDIAAYVYLTRVGDNQSLQSQFTLIKNKYQL